MQEQQRLNTSGTMVSVCELELWCWQPLRLLL
jgi:hypothetical protein